MIKKELLLGDEAIAWGALNAGLSGVYAYPGTPSTEITEFIQMHPLTRERGIHCNWSANEKTALVVGVRNHEVGVDGRLGGRLHRGKDARSKGEVRHKMAVHCIEVHVARALNGGKLICKVAKVSRKDGGCHLHVIL